MSSEDERIERLRARYENGRLGVRLGIGDDAAVLAPESGSAVVSVDVMVEGVHFRRAWLGAGLSLVDLGRRAAIAALSDLAAMGAEPRAMLSSLIVPDWLDDEMLDAIADGVAEVATRHRAPVVGGNLSRGGELSISTTVMGAASAHVLTRSGASPGDQLYVTGTLGGAALGWRAIDAGRSEEDALRHCVKRWREPQAQLIVGARLVGTASAALDVSDGLLKDLSRLCRSSGVAARVEAALLPLDASHQAACVQLGVDPLACALSGGEDYELLFTAPAALASDELATRIGYITAGAGVTVVDAHGVELPVSDSGFDHFA